MCPGVRPRNDRRHAGAVHGLEPAGRNSLRLCRRGVLGRRQCLFDLFGDTVNTAARMQSNGVKGCIVLRW